ncbi:hypothetical protein GUITHDRAFT_113198 [Guillardia theta CCMP2712]|uniref:Zn(2)-C6 fungal-type domain-containing protein n=1 Tax=Guillardia theta (strain CCMP2712) TaxID=905079 RepID=L1IXQ4_GUITC|nr:hypothetical protein GUITHDRAFT_113198 [Guillardia theta CCMP2712]EKX40664.1 hypothetical protein GUITHDRAFT_113198 [Guillardia theta CCMP2712]|eukprot:XP_005827644.1 hypothetical protein GUITHDRAFT_113198 [Guillardia theta CCMP2712]
MFSLDYDEWCQQMAENLSCVNRYAAQNLVTDFSAASEAVALPIVKAEGARSDNAPRSKRSKYIAKSCAECKLKKRKCSEARPCVMCIMSGTSDKCLTEARTVSLSTSICDHREAYFQDVRAQEASLNVLKETCAFSGVNITLVRPLWELGFDVSMLFKAFKILPLDLKVAVDELVDLIRQGLSKSSLRNPEYLSILQHQNELGRLSKFQHCQNAKRLGNQMDEEDEGEVHFDRIACNERWGHGRWLSVEFDSRLICKRIRIGDEMSNLLGCHHTEILSRFFCHDLVKSMSEYELLVAWTSSIMCSFDSQSIFYIKIMRGSVQDGDRRVQHLKCCFHKNFNGDGIQIGYTILFEPVSSEIYQQQKNRFLPPSYQKPQPDRDIDKEITKESIVFMRKLRVVSEDRLSHLAGLIKRWVGEVKACHPLFANNSEAEIEMMRS